MPAKSSPQADLVELGRISGVFGVRGELRLFLHNRESDLLRRGRRVVLLGPDGARREVVLSARAGAGGRVLGRIDGVDSPEQAAALQEWTIAIAASDLPPASAGEFYLRDVLGADAVVEGTVVGRVMQVHQSGPHDIFEVRLDAGWVAYAPSTPEHVLEIDGGRRRVVFAPGALAVDDE